MIDSVTLRPMVDRIVCKPLVDFTRDQQLGSGIWIPADARKVSAVANGAPGDFECHDYEVVAVGPLCRTVAPGMVVRVQDVYPHVVRVDGSPLHFYREREVEWVWDDADRAQLEEQARRHRVASSRRSTRRAKKWWMD